MTNMATVFRIPGGQWLAVGCDIKTETTRAVAGDSGGCRTGVRSGGGVFVLPLHCRLVLQLPKLIRDRQLFHDSLGTWALVALNLPVRSPTIPKLTSGDTVWRKHIEMERGAQGAPTVPAPSYLSHWMQMSEALDVFNCVREG